jgi:predicted Zn-dependent protease
LHSAIPEYFQLQHDPGELKNLWPTHEEDARSYRERIHELARLPRLSRGERDAKGPQMEDQLRALGYAGAASAESQIPEPLGQSDRPAPSQRAEELALFYDAALLANAGRRPEAIVKMQALADERPNNVYARDLLAGFLVEELRFSEARDVLEDLFARGHDRYSIRFQLGTSCEALDDHAEAKRHFEAALKHRPGDEPAKDGFARASAKVAGRAVRR